MIKAIVGAVTVVAAGWAHAQPDPSKPVRVIVP